MLCNNFDYILVHHNLRASSFSIREVIDLAESFRFQYVRFAHEHTETKVFINDIINFNLFVKAELRIFD